MARDDVIVLHNGAAYAGWKKVDVKQDFDKAVGECSLVISRQPGRPLPMKLGDDVSVLIAGQPVITGYVKEIDGGHSWSKHDINIKICDQTRFFVDSTIGPGIAFAPPVKLKTVLDGTLKKMGLSKIKVIDKASPDPYGHAEVPVGAIDDTGFGWADKWTRKRQVVLNTDGKGNLVIDRNQMRRGPGMLHKGPEDDPLNNVKESTYRITDDGRHNKTACAAQKSTNDKDWWESKAKGEATAQADPLSTKWGQASDSAVRPERRLHYRARRGLEGQSPKKAARWRSNLARARGFQYTATVQGFDMSPGTLWWPGFIIPVFDYEWEISDELFISAVRFEKDWDGGAVTEITCTYKDAFSESEEAGKGGARTGSSGLGNTGTGAYDADDLDLD